MVYVWYIFHTINLGCHGTVEYEKFYFFVFFFFNEWV